jgi:hypothetical protein
MAANPVRVAWAAQASLSLPPPLAKEPTLQIPMCGSTAACILYAPPNATAEELIKGWQDKAARAVRVCECASARVCVVGCWGTRGGVGCSSDAEGSFARPRDPLPPVAPLFLRLRSPGP